MRYLITFTCYGCHLHGSEGGSVDRHHNVFGTAGLASSAQRATRASALMSGPSYSLDDLRREIVLSSICQTCVEREWDLLAAHVRSTHVHIVVGADDAPERVMSTLKARASFALNHHGIDPPGQQRWTRHGSTKYLWDERSVCAAVKYVIELQGDETALFQR